MHRHQGTVGDLLQDITVVSKCIAHHDIVVLEEDLGIAVLRRNAILDNDKDLIECPSHLLSKLIIGFNSEGGPDILSLSGKIATAGGISHLAGSHIEEAAQRRVIGNLTGAATDQNIRAADVERGTVVFGDFGGSETGGKILEVGAIAKASDVVELDVVDLPAEDRMVQLKWHAGIGIGNARQGMSTRETKTSRIVRIHPLLDGVLGTSHLGVHVTGMSIG